MRAGRGLFLLVERARFCRGRQTALLARATRGLRRPSLDARSKGQSAYSLRGSWGVYRSTSAVKEYPDPLLWEAFHFEWRENRRRKRFWLHETVTETL